MRSWGLGYDCVDLKCATTKRRASIRSVACAIGCEHGKGACSSRLDMDRLPICLRSGIGQSSQASALVLEVRGAMRLLPRPYARVADTGWLIQGGRAHRQPLHACSGTHCRAASPMALIIHHLLQLQRPHLCDQAPPGGAIVRGCRRILIKRIAQRLYILAQRP